MTDPNMQNFQGRLGRINRIHRAGGGFEADGTLGMSYYNSHRTKRRSYWLIKLALVLAAFLVILKVSMQLVIGEAAYADRISKLAAGTDSDRLGANILQVDPLSAAVTAQLKRIIH